VKGRHERRDDDFVPTVLRAVHALAPNARICFNTTPADTAEAVQRWIEP